MSAIARMATTKPLRFSMFARWSCQRFRSCCPILLSWWVLYDGDNCSCRCCKDAHDNGNDESLDPVNPRPVNDAKAKHLLTRGTGNTEDDDEPGNPVQHCPNSFSARRLFRCGLGEHAEQVANSALNPGLTLFSILILWLRHLRVV